MKKNQKQKIEEKNKGEKKKTYANSFSEWPNSWALSEGFPRGNFGEQRGKSSTLITEKLE